jgi:hypothetical protein
MQALGIGLLFQGPLRPAINKKAGIPLNERADLGMRFGAQRMGSNIHAARSCWTMMEGFSRRWVSRE